jgi:long-subunit acyl-CoA synthetase (AMP-forming)
LRQSLLDGDHEPPRRLDRGPLTLLDRLEHPRRTAPWSCQQHPQTSRRDPAQPSRWDIAAEQALYVNVRNLFGGRVRQAVTGAAPIAPSILEFFYACGVRVMEGYGMTETASVASVNTPEASRFGSVGRPVPGVQVRIADDDGILIKGPNIFNGYYRDADARRETVVDGWLQTGDLGRLDEDGFLR